MVETVTHQSQAQLRLVDSVLNDSLGGGEIPSRSDTEIFKAT
jgi:hypothetical protein